jgi:pimeloyl-ACP methyl ester carboxylesterase
MANAMGGSGGSGRPVDGEAPVVVLLHGLGRTHRSMAPLRRYIERLGYATWSRTYPSRQRSIAALAEEVADWIRGDLGERPVVGVTHSMGGILIRYMRDRLPWRGAIMLAPPNQGSVVAAQLAGRPLFRRVLGPAGRELGDPSTWPSPPEPFAIVAGTRGPSWANVPSLLIRGMRLIPSGEAHDGTVRVVETRLDGMVGFAEVDASHPFLMNHPATRELVRSFLATGGFAGDGRAAR